MRLELGTFPVRDVIFGNSTDWDDGVLKIDHDGLVGRILKDPRIKQARLELARPGESTRITKMRDTIEPRVKVAGPGIVYPGLCGRSVTPVGSGRTHRLEWAEFIRGRTHRFEGGQFNPSRTHRLE